MKMTTSDIEIGQIWKITKDKYSKFQKGEYFIVLSRDYNGKHDAWKVAIFRGSSNPVFWGGAIIADLYDYEVIDIADYVNDLKKIVY